jgi:hypothetical protein
MCVELCPCELVWLGVAPVALDAVQYNLQFLLSEALHLVARKHRVWEPDDKKVPDYSNTNRGCALNTIMVVSTRKCFRIG